MIHLNSVNSVPHPVLAGVTEGKVESWNFHSHSVVVRSVPLPCHRVSGDTQKIVMRCPLYQVRYAQQRTKGEPELSALTSSNKVPLSFDSVKLC